jgi:hypothetical protein
MAGACSRRSVAGWAILTIVCLLPALPTSAAAQSAWLPFQGEASLSVAFQALEFDGHFFEDATQHDVAPSRARLGIFQVEYGLTDRLAVTARLPYIASRFTGRADEPIMVFIRERYEEFRRLHPDIAADSSLDTGNYYATFQDLTFSLRYNAVNQAVIVTPAIGVTVPSHDYRTIGEAAPGQNRLALHSGVNVGRLLDPWLPNAYVHGRYTYSFVQRLHGVRLDRSSAELEAGYAITPTVSVRALGNWMHTHGGIGFEEAAQDLLVFLSHDRMLASRYWHLGAGTTVTLTDSIDLDGAFVKTVSGADTHSGYGLNVGLTWRFLQPRPGPAPPQALMRR